MNELLLSLVLYGFDELKSNLFEAFTQRDNQKSKVVLERNGFALQENRICSCNSSNLIFTISLF